MEPLEWIGLISAIVSALSAGGAAVGGGVEQNKAEAEQRKVEESQASIEKKQEEANRKAYADRRRAAMARIVHSHLGQLPENYEEPEKVYTPIQPNSNVSDVLSGVSQASAAGAGIADQIGGYIKPGAAKPGAAKPATTKIEPE